MEKRRGFFVENYSKCWDFLRESRWYVVFAFGIFALFALVGFVLPIFFRERIFALLVEMVAELEGKGSLEIIGLIFFNNIKASFFAIVFGIGLGIFPLAMAVMNGYLVGFVSRLVASEAGIFSLWRLLPHGIFELPAIFFSIGIGLKIGTDIFRKDAMKKLRYNFREGLRFFVFVVLPLLVVAGIIEGLLIGFGV